MVRFFHKKPKKHNWSGSFYELAIELGSPSDDRLRTALTRLWSHPSLDGCYLDRNQELDQQPRVSPLHWDVAPGAHLLGLVQLPNGQQVACGSIIVREDDGPDWLDFYIPMVALMEVYGEGTYAFDEDVSALRSWQEPLDKYLAELGAYVFAEVPFALGLIGHEVSGDVYAEQIAREGIPSQRYIGYLWPSHNKISYIFRNCYQYP